MQFTPRKLTVLVLLALWVTSVPAEEIVEYIDIPNRIAWLPQGSDFVIRFLIDLSDHMISHYGIVLERIKHMRALMRSHPPAYNSVNLFYDNDIQEPGHHGKPNSNPKPVPQGPPGYSREAFKTAFESIKKFAGNSARPTFQKHLN